MYRFTGHSLIPLFIEETSLSPLCASAIPGPADTVQISPSLLDCVPACGAGHWQTAGGGTSRPGWLAVS